MQAIELEQLIEANPGKVLVIDVRERDEITEAPLFPAGTAYYAGMPLSVLRMLPQAELASRLREQVSAQGRDMETVTLVLSCRSGGRSCQAQMLLEDVGIQSENLDGGYAGWIQFLEDQRGRE